MREAVKSILIAILLITFVSLTVLFVSASQYIAPTLPSVSPPRSQSGIAVPRAVAVRHDGDTWGYGPDGGPIEKYCESLYPALRELFASSETGGNCDIADYAEALTNDGVLIDFGAAVILGVFAEIHLPSTGGSPAFSTIFIATEGDTVILFARHGASVIKWDTTIAVTDIDVPLLSRSHDAFDAVIGASLPGCSPACIDVIDFPDYGYSHYRQTDFAVSRDILFVAFGFGDHPRKV